MPLYRVNDTSAAFRLLYGEETFTLTFKILIVHFNSDFANLYPLLVNIHLAAYSAEVFILTYVANNSMH